MENHIGHKKVDAKSGFQHALNILTPVFQKERRNLFRISSGVKFIFNNKTEVFSFNAL